MKELKQKVRLDHKWRDLKKNGIKAIPLDTKETFNNINTSLQSHNILLVPNGELEGFLDIGGHGPSWVANVFETYPDLSGDVFDDARLFVSTWGI